MKQLPFSDLGCAAILLGAAFVCSIPFLLGFKPIPQQKVADNHKRDIKKLVSKKKKPRKKKVKGPKPVEEGDWRDIPVSERKDKGLKWKQVFFDDFSEDTIGKNWIWPVGKWRVRSGELRNYSTKAGASIYLKGADFSGDFRISYDCYTLKANKEKLPCDMSFYAGASPPADVLRWEMNIDPKSGKSLVVEEAAVPEVDKKKTEGKLKKKKTKRVKKRPEILNYKVWKYNYWCAFGCNQNLWTGLARKGVSLFIDKKNVIKLGKKYRVVIERVGNRMSLHINDKEIYYGEDLTFPEKNPLNKYGVLYTYMRIVAFDNVKVYMPEEQ
ncbi:MAG: hypothetical protein ACYTFY_11775 [Planctomycetota bacterium]|jgi:hypothetical protein